MFKLIGKSWRDYVTIKNNFIPEYYCLVSNPTTLKSLGWQPKVDFKELASIMLLSDNKSFVK